ncbi:hypothetical protein K3495_g7120 [Podosphaera aphanis]|nr:hypothetical protein K3495_g7120 [Podosphaera aphanis]
MRPVEYLSMIKKDALQKTCSRHTKKRGIQSFNQWNDFINEIDSRSRPVFSCISFYTAKKANKALYQSQIKEIDIKCIFALDQLPVSFDSELELIEEGSPDRKFLNQAIDQLAKISWQNYGFRFRRAGANTQYLHYTYLCCQDTRLDFDSKNEYRDRGQMERFECASILSFRPPLNERTLNLRYHHKHHITYDDIHMTPEIRKLVDDRVITQTPQEIYHHLLPSGLTTADKIAGHQVYYQWKRDNDPVLSAGMLLEENRDMYHHRPTFVANVRALGFYIRASIDVLSGTTREIAIDATYGTNNAGMELNAVLAELDGAEAPMAYLFVEKNNSFGTSSPETMTQVIYQFLRALDNLGVNAFVDCDKDKFEINAIEQVWPSARIQLCFWHAKRAVEMKLKKSNANSLLHYSPGDAQVIVPSLEIFWGSIPVKRPDSNHIWFGFYQCKSKKIVFEGNGFQEHSSPENQKTVLEKFSQHFNAHPLIPGRNGILRTASTIHSVCATEMYNWFYTNGFYKLWAYLFASWYDFG